MLNFNRSTLDACVVHQVGNKSLEQDLQLSRKPLELEGSLEFHLVNYFLKPFKGMTDVYTFHHEIELDLNVMYNLSSSLFDEGNLGKISAAMAKHLYDQGRFSAIKGGSLFIALFSDIVVGDEICRGIGLFKAESQDDFIKVNNAGQHFEVMVETGINEKRLDKGCLIVYDEKEDALKVFTYEHNNADTAYWRKDFLGIQALQDENYQTKNFMKICKDFVTERFPEQFEVSKADQIDLLNRSVEYFKENSHFKMKEFAEQVLEHDDVVKEFRKFKSEVQREDEVEVDNSFAISAQAVKKQSKTFKSVLKLDKNFHVYIHGNRNMIERGVDEKGRKFYKIYFEEES
jgi:hypothetical protein